MGRTPLILLAHGQCPADSDHYQKWQLLPSQLARAGFVVAIPQLFHNSPPLENDTDLARLTDTAAWLRSRWAHRARLASPPATGLIGHSYGSLLTGRLAASSPLPPVNAMRVAATPRPVEGRAGQSGRLAQLLARVRRLQPPTRPGQRLPMRVGAYASLGGKWQDGPEIAQSLTGVNMPKLFVRGSGFSETGSGIDNLWPQFPGAKHSALFAALEHWDYLLRGPDNDPTASPEHSLCTPSTRYGPCRDYTFVVWDIVTMFFGRYLPSPSARDVPSRIHPSLVPPALDLSPEQQFFAGGYLGGFGRLAQAGTHCTVTLTYEANGQAGTVSRQGQSRSRPTVS